MVLTEEDVLSGKYTVDDVVLPLPGCRVSYPLNDVGTFYHELAEKDGVSLTESAHGVKEFSLTSITGAYRQVFQKPKDFTWEVLTYVDETASLSLTDLDVLATKLPSVGEKDSINRKQELGSSNGSGGQEPQTALKLSFTLPASSYATMAVRELLKMSTSAAFHKTLNT